MKSLELPSGYLSHSVVLCPEKEIPDWLAISDKLLGQTLISKIYKELRKNQKKNYEKEFRVINVISPSDVKDWIMLFKEASD